MVKKEEFYKWVKVAGFISVIPLTLAAGPIGGYFIGEYITKIFHLNVHATLFFIALGFIGSLIQTVKIIKVIIGIDRKS